MRWSVEIKQASLTRRNLSDLLNGIGFTLVDGIRYIELTSPVFDPCATAQEAFDIAKKVRRAFTGPTHIDPTFTLGSVNDHSVSPPISTTFVELTGIGVTMQMGDLTVSTSAPVGLDSAGVAQWALDSEEQEYQALLEHQRSTLEPAFTSEKASQMLEMLALKEPSGELIYKIYELTEGQSSNRKNFEIHRENFHTQYGISTSEFDRFKDAVHNPNVTGDWARHANPQRLNSSNPMTKDEAAQFVRRIAEKWLAHVRTTKSP